MNSFAILKRLDLKRCPLTKSTILSRPFVLTGQNVFPMTLSMLKNDKQEKTQSEQYQIFGDSNYHIEFDTKNVNKMINDEPHGRSTFREQTDSTFSNIPNLSSSLNLPHSSTSSSYPSMNNLPNQLLSPYLPSFKKTLTDLLNENYTAEETLTEKIVEHEFGKDFILSQLQHKLKIPENICSQIFLLYGKTLLKNYQNAEDFLSLCDLLKQFPHKELCHNWYPFSLTLRDLDNRISILKEIGFKSIDSTTLEGYSQLLNIRCSEMTNFFMVGNNVYEDCFHSFCQVLDLSDDERSSLKEYIEKKYENVGKISVSQLRSFCLAKYLSNNFLLSMNKAEHVCRRFSNRLNVTCLSHIKKNLTLLLESYNYSSSYVLHNGLFITLDPNNIEQISIRFQEIVGPEVFERLTQNTRLLKTNCDQLIENYHLLTEKCKNLFLPRSTPLFFYSTHSLKAMFEEIESNEDIKTLNLKVFGMDYLALHKSTILNRIKIIKDKEISISFVPTTFFISDEKEFNSFVSSCMNNSELRVRFYLEQHFGLKYDDVRHLLRKIPKCTTEKYSKQNAKKIIEFLISMNVERDKIIENIYLILYDYKDVKSAYFNSCSRYNQTLHRDPNFFQHVTNYLVHISDFK